MELWESLAKLFGGEVTEYSPLKIDNTGPIRMARYFILFSAPCGCTVREELGFQIIDGKMGPRTMKERVFKFHPCSRDHALLIREEYLKRANDYTNFLREN